MSSATHGSPDVDVGYGASAPASASSPLSAPLSAIVVNWNSGGRLVACVDALLAQRQEAGLDEVVVVDNASSDDSLSRLEPLADSVSVLQTGANLGYGRAATAGLEATSTPLVVVLNPDVSVEPGALRALADSLAEDPTCGLIGPRLLTPAGKVQPTCGTAPTLWGEICGRFLLHLVLPFLKFRGRRPSELKPAGWVTGACFMARRSALEAVGGLDSAIFMYYEDVDLCVRLWKAGWRVCYQPGAHARHVGGGSSRQVLEAMLVASEVSYGHYVRKHFGSLGAAILLALRPVEMVLRSTLWGLVATIWPSRRGEAHARLRAYTRMIRGAGICTDGEPVQAKTGQVGRPTG